MPDAGLAEIPQEALKDLDVLVAVGASGGDGRTVVHVLEHDLVNLEPGLCDLVLDAEKVVELVGLGKHPHFDGLDAHVPEIAQVRWREFFRVLETDP